MPNIYTTTFLTVREMEMIFMKYKINIDTLKKYKATHPSFDKSWWNNWIYFFHSKKKMCNLWSYFHWYSIFLKTFSFILFVFLFLHKSVADYFPLFYLLVMRLLNTYKICENLSTDNLIYLMTALKLQSEAFTRWPGSSTCSWIYITK